MNSRSSQVLLYTAGGGGRSPSAPARLPAAACHPPTLLWWGRQGRQSSGRGVWAPGPRTELCHRCPSDPFLSWASVSPSAKRARGHAPPAPLLGAPPLTAACRDALVGAVSAVLVPVTEPALGDTDVGARAGEGAGAARFAFCGGNRERLRRSGWGDAPAAVPWPGGVCVCVGGVCPSRGHLPTLTPAPASPQ